MRTPNLFSLGLLSLILLPGLLALALLPGADAAPAPADPADGAVEEAVAAGLKWLALHQAPDGHWSLGECNQHAREQPLPQGKTFKCNCTGLGTYNNDVAGTSLALLPFLAAGISHKPTKQKPDYSRTVLGGLQYILTKQGKDGAFTPVSYGHAMASIAVCNAYRLSADPKLKVPAQKALDYIVFAQDPTGGGWRYNPRSPGDISVTSWQMQALKVGQIAKLTVPAACLKSADRFIDSCEVKKQGQTEGYRYRADGDPMPSTDSMTAAATLDKLYLGVNPRNPTLMAGIERLKKTPPHATKNYYYLHYATQAMYHAGGKESEDWGQWWNGGAGRKGLRDVLLQDMDQGRDPKHDHQKGSWAANAEGQVNVGGRIMATSLALLMLQTPKQTPLFQRDNLPKEKGKP